MFNLIIGPNSSGKTKLLTDKLLELGVNKSATNLRLATDKIYDISDDKIDELNMKMPFTVVNSYGSIALKREHEKDPDYNKDIRLKEVITALCSTKDYFVWDEPEYGVSDYLKNSVATAVRLCKNSFKECWVATHFPNFLSMQPDHIYMPDGHGNLVEITQDEADDFLGGLYD